MATLWLAMAMILGTSMGGGTAERTSSSEVNGGNNPATLQGQGQPANAPQPYHYGDVITGQGTSPDAQ